MSEKLHVGSAWAEATAGDPSKTYYGVALDLGGLVPPIHCRIAENSKPKGERSPSHYMFFTPLDGEGRMVGSFWPRKSGKTETTYLTGHIEVRRFGLVELQGGAKLDLRLAGGTVRVKLVAAKPSGTEDGKNRPTHYLLRMVPLARKAADEPVEAEVEEEVEEEEQVA